MIRTSRRSLTFFGALASAGLLWLGPLTPSLRAQADEITPPTEEADIVEASEAAGGNSVQEANLSFAAGERALKRAEKALAKLEKNPGDKKEKLTNQAKKAFAEAEQKFLDAIKSFKQHPKAYTALGNVWRKTGQVERSLQAFEAALVVVPDDPAAIEGRGESHLVLGQLDLAKADYEKLVRLDSKRAAALLEVMQRWVATYASAPGNLDAATVESFAAWVQQTAKGS